MRTLHFGLRVADLGRSLAFYTAVGYEVVGSVPQTPLGHLTVLKLPGDDIRHHLTCPPSVPRQQDPVANGSLPWPHRAPSILPDMGGQQSRNVTSELNGR